MAISRRGANPHAVRRLSESLHGVFFGRNFNKNTIGELIAGKLTGPENGALNTVPEVLFVSGRVVLRTADNTVVRGLGVSGAPGGDKDEACNRRCCQASRRVAVKWRAERA